ncbi:MAG: hypothetical protein WCO07_03150 [bacterium]
MSISKKIFRRIIGQEYEENSNFHYNNSNNSQSNNSTKRNNNRLFFFLSLLSALFFVFFGVFELLFRSPLSSWFSGVWQTVLKVSPQSLVNLPNQITGSETLMQKTVADLLAFAPGSFDQIWAIISSPIGAVVGILLVFLAVFIRFSGKFISSLRSSQIAFLKIISWITLGGSFVPIILEYGL